MVSGGISPTQGAHFSASPLNPQEADMRTSKVIKQIEKRRDAVGKERDKLDAMIGDLDALRATCDEAWDYLQRARDVLSEQA